MAVPVRTWASPRAVVKRAKLIDSATEARLAATGCTELFDEARLGRISKMGNLDSRKWPLWARMRCSYHRKPHTDALRTWTKRLIEKKPFKLVAVALANKLARIAFALMKSADELSRASGLTLVAFE